MDRVSVETEGEEDLICEARASSLDCVRETRTMSKPCLAS